MLNGVISAMLHPQRMVYVETSHEFSPPSVDANTPTHSFLSSMLRLVRGIFLF